MRNLKRALSLALAAVMLIGMMVVGASAVSYNDFTDRDEIVNKDAVSMLTTLGVIDGKTDGSFDPEGTVRRDEMAKMISVIMNQGVDNNELYSGVDSKLTDIGDNWAKGHINYCFTLGIIAGRGDGRFDPAANVTGAEAAKMLLVAAGYDPSIEGFVGTDWAINTNAKASALGIFRNFNKNVMLPLNRDDAALLIYNALDIEMIQKYENGYAIAYADRRTILSAMYGVYKVEGVVVGNKWAELEETDYDAALKDGKTTLSNVKLYASTTASTEKGEVVEYSGNISFNVDTTVEMIGKTVTLYIRKTTILADSVVLGVTTKDSVNVVEGSVANESAVKDFLKGTGLTVTSDTEYYVNYGYLGTGNSAEIYDNADFNYNGIKVEVIDNNNDGDVDYVLYLVETLSYVKKYSSKNETLTVPAMNDGKITKFEDVVFADEVTTDDLVLFVEYGGRDYISTPESVTGKITRIDRDAEKELYVTIEGDSYYQSYIPDAAAEDEVVEHFDITEAATDPGFDTEVIFILDSNGYIVAYQAPEAAAPNYALVLGSAWTQNALTKSGQLSILKTDKTEGTYTINWDASAKAAFWDKASDADGKYDSAEKKAAIAALEAYLGTRDVVVDDQYKTPLNNASGSVIKYAIDDDDVITIKSVMTNAADEIAYAGNGIDESDGADTTVDSYLNRKYETGDGTLYADADSKYAVDLNTIAFYYAGEDDYGVAIGYDEMYDVAANAKGDTDTKTVQVWTTEGGKLADVLLFNSREDRAVDKDYLYVLSANALTSKILELNVIFEDGTVDTIEVSREKYGDDFDDDADFETVWAYSVKDEVYTLYEVTGEGYTVAADNAHLIKKGTIVMNAETDNETAEGEENTAWNVGDYYTITSKSAVWDITDVTKDDDKAPAGEFLYKTAKEAIIVYDTDVNTVLVAWIKDLPGEVADDDEEIDATIDVTVNLSDVPFTVTIDVPAGHATLKAYELNSLVKAGVAQELAIKSSEVDPTVAADGTWIIKTPDITYQSVTVTVNYAAI